MLATPRRAPPDTARRDGSSLLGTLLPTTVPAGASRHNWTLGRAAWTFV